MANTVRVRGSLIITDGLQSSADDDNLVLWDLVILCFIIIYSPCIWLRNVTLEVIIILIILIPVIAFVIIRRKGELRVNFSKILFQIAGNFLLILGILMLFPAFYTFFHGKDDSMKYPLLAVSLFLIVVSNLITRRAGKKQKSAEES